MRQLRNDMSIPYYSKEQTNLLTYVLYQQADVPKEYRCAAQAVSNMV